MFSNASTATDTFNRSRNVVPCSGLCVECLDGCTLTQGYWKTHNPSFKGGASKKADETWLLIGDWDEGFVEECRDLGMAMAAGLDSGIF